MGDFNSSLPVRTQSNGDVVAFIADATTPTQLTAVDAHGSLAVLLKDAAGTAITSTTVNSLDRLNVYLSSEGITGSAVPFSTQLVGGSDGTNLHSLLTDSTGRLIIVSSNFPATVDTNWGAVGASTIRTAAEIGNAAGAADFNFGAASAQTLRTAALLGNASGLIGYNFAAADAQTIRAAALIGNATGAADFNFGAASAQTLRVAALLGNATGLIDYNFGAADAQTIRTASLIGNAAGVADFNYGTIGAQSIRVASQIGNATGAANFGNGATGAQTLRVAANLAVAGTDVTALNPVPVTVVSTILGTNINKYNTTVNVAIGASVNHNYAITALKTFTGKMFWISASGKIRADVQTSPDGTTFTTFWTGFNSTSDPNISIDLDLLDITDTGTGAVIRIIVTNRDLAVFDVFSTISGIEN
jgi:hypothetical protein